MLGLTPSRERVGALVRQEEWTLGNVGCCGLEVRQQRIYGNKKTDIKRSLLCSQLGLGTEKKQNFLNSVDSA